MGDEQATDLLIRAAAAYEGVVADPRRFGPVAAQLAAEARHAGAAEALAVALRAQAWSERARLGNARAKALLDEAARVARSHRLHGRLGEVLVTRAAVNHELGRLGAAQRDLDRAAPLLGGGRSAELELQQAALFQNIGRLPEAAARYRRVLARPDAPAAVKAIMANNLALIEVQHGHHDAALGLLDQAAELAAAVGPAVAALVTQSRGWVTVQIGKLADSLRLFDQAARGYVAAGLALGEHYLEQVDALVDLRLLPEASAMAARAVAQFEAHGVRLMGAEAQLRAAQLALLTGDGAGAAGQAARAGRSFRAQRRAAWAARAAVLEVQARALTGAATAAELAAARRAAAMLERRGMLASAVEAHLTAGRVAAALGRPRAAGVSLERAHRLARRAPVLVRLKGQVAAALAAGLRRPDRTVLRHCRAGLTDLTRHRAALPSLELRALASGHGAELGRLGLGVLLRSGSGPRVLEWLERTRAAALLAVEPPATAGIHQELAALRGVQAELVQARHDAGVEPPELLARQAAIESRVRRATWSGQAPAAAGGDATPVAALRELLGGQLLVAYGVHDARLFAVVLEPRRTRLLPLGPLEAVRLEVELLLFSLRRLTRPGAPAAGLASARAGADAALRRLAGLLVDPLGLPGDVPLVMVPPAELLRVPWSALHPAPVSLAPSASLWARTRQAGGRPPGTGHAGPVGPGGRVVLVAGPELAGATAEVDTLRRLHRRPTVLAPPASTVGAVVDALDGAGLAHLACHGHLRADNPMFSSLELSDGLLSVHELHLRAVAPRRIILAACDSAADVGYEGDELLGFVGALLARGTAGLVASAVVVPDLQAVSLMRALHQRLRGGATLAEALHAARAGADLDDPGAFVNWCAFTAFGAA